MADHSHSHEPAAVTETPFSDTEIQQFDADDAEAGAAIGKMLSIFFLYTVIVMTASAVATYWWITNPSVH